MQQSLKNQAQRVTWGQQMSRTGPGGISTFACVLSAGLTRKRMLCVKNMSLVLPTYEALLQIVYVSF